MNLDVTAYPLIDGLIKLLPPADTRWPIETRQKWLQLAAVIFDLVYPHEDGLSLKVEIQKDPEALYISNVRPIPDPSFAGMTIADATRKYLQTAGTPKSTADIAFTLKQHGFNSTAKNFVATVATTLSMHKALFCRVHGMWGLREWYPEKTETEETQAEETEAS
jgi:hypothetical protein